MDQVDEVKSKVDVVEVISSYIPLKKMGRNMGGLCPFHGEKTPSFMVSPERQVWKCFGCGEGGDVFTFLEKIESWDFREALEELAKRAGVKLVSRSSSEGGKVREKIVEMNQLTSKFYSHILNKHVLGETARQYLKGRGIGEDLWQKFDLGFAPNSWDNVLNFLTKKGFNPAEIGVSGLVVGREGASKQSRTTAFYDRFRGRIMFPIKDARGKVLGFSGRVLDSTREALLRQGSGGQAKYINSPETPVFHKGELLFGLDVARTAIRDQNEAVLVEGEFDVISANKAGVENAVASKGTALTDRQVTALSRLCENVVLCFDMDVAGDSASRRGIELLDIAGVNIKVVRLAGGVKDPDEFAQKDSEGFRKAIKSASNIYDYLIGSTIARNNPKTPEGKKKIGQEILPVLSKISDDLIRAHYTTKLAKELELDPAFISEAIEKKRDLSVMPAAININEKDNVKNVSVLEEYFLALFLAGDAVYDAICQQLAPEDFENEEARRFWGIVRDIISSSKPKQTGKLLAEVPKEFSNFIDQMYLININPEFMEREAWAGEISKVATRIKKASIGRMQFRLSTLLKEAQKEHNERRIEQLSKKFDKLSQKLADYK